MNKHRFGEAFDNVSREPPIVRDIILQHSAEKQWRYKIKCYWHKYPQLFSSLSRDMMMMAAAELTRANDSNNFCIFKNFFPFHLDSPTDSRHAPQTCSSRREVHFSITHFSSTLLSSKRTIDMHCIAVHRRRSFRLRFSCFTSCLIRLRKKEYFFLTTSNYIIFSSLSHKLPFIHRRALAETTSSLS